MAMHALSPAEKESILVEVQSRVRGDIRRRMEADPHFDLAALVNESIFHERHRIRGHPSAPRHKEDAKFWGQAGKRLGKASQNELHTLLDKIIRRYLEEIIGHFDPRVYDVATRVIPFALSGLLNTMSPSRFAQAFPSYASLDDHLLFKGEVEALKKLEQRGTVILVPTHASNLDSILLGYCLHCLGLPPFTYGAGINLFSNPLISFFMHNLGAYRVDRLKREPLYKDVLKEYAARTIEMGFHNLFFPGGTRSRSGVVEQKLKLGLVGTGLQAFQNNLRSGAERPNVYVVPCTLSFHLVLEAETLIEDSLKEAGQARFIISDDEFSQPTRILNFFRNLISLDARIVLTVSHPRDPFGNRVLEDGTSVDQRERPIDIAGYVQSGGEIRRDAVRDAEYTRELGQEIADSFKRDNVLLSTHLLASVLFDMCRERHPDLDLYQLVRDGPLHKEGFAIGDVYDRMDRRLTKLRKLVREGKVRFGEERIGWDAAGLVADGLRHFGVYHTRPAARRRGTRIFPGDVPLLLFYGNRTRGYDL